MAWTSLTKKTETGISGYTFSSQGGSTTFYFRKLKAEPDPDLYYAYSPKDYIDQVSSYRGSSFQTIGGSYINQFFGYSSVGGLITFTAWLNEDEYLDLKGAYAHGGTWILTDVHNNSYEVIFEFNGGLKVVRDLPVNGMYLISFKFRRMS